MSTHFQIDASGEPTVHVYACFTDLACSLPARREEPGDVLLQVVFHAKVASERGDGTGFTVDDIATGIVTTRVTSHASHDEQEKRDKHRWLHAQVMTDHLDLILCEEDRQQPEGTMSTHV